MSDKPDPEREYADAIHILNRLGEYYTLSEALVWLVAPQPLFDGRSALWLIQQNEREKLDEMLDQLDAGVYL